VGKSKVILPRKLSVNPQAMARAITNTMNATARAIQTDFNVTTQTWDDKPTFAIASPTPYTRKIGTDDAIYSMLNEGTPEHDIAPRPGGTLVFRTPFRPKSRVRYIGSNAGSKGGNVVFTRRPIHHPGTEARDFDKVIAEKWNRQFAGIMQRAVDAEV
jgi:hypothetical protein